jgi:hypothetical protein
MKKYINHFLKMSVAQRSRNLRATFADAPTALHANFPPSGGLRGAFLSLAIALMIAAGASAQTTWNGAVTLTDGQIVSGTGGVYKNSNSGGDTKVTLTGAIAGNIIINGGCLDFYRSNDHTYNRY